MPAPTRAIKDQNFVSTLIGVDKTTLSIPTAAAVNETTGALLTELAASAAVIGHVITDAGSVTTATLSAETTKVIGTVNQGTSPWIINTGSATAAAIPANAFMIGVSDGTNLVAVRQASNGLNSTAGGLLAVNNAAQFDDVSPTSITENSFGNLRISANRNLYNTIRDAAGNERGLNISSGGNISVDTVTTVTTVSTLTTLTGTTTLTPGTGAANLGKAEDAAHTTADVGVFSLGVRNDTLADVTNATADYSQLSTDIKGRVMTAGSPRALKGMVQVQISNSTSETTIIAATASTFHDVYGIILANTGATTTKVSIRDDTAGTVRMIIEVPTLETRGFMLTVDSAVPQTAVNKNWTAQCASATTALEVTGFYVSMV